MTLSHDIMLLTFIYAVNMALGQISVHTVFIIKEQHINSIMNDVDLDSIIANQMSMMRK